MFEKRKVYGLTAIYTKGKAKIQDQKWSGIQHGLNPIKYGSPFGHKQGFGPKCLNSTSSLSF